MGKLRVKKVNKKGKLSKQRHATIDNKTSKKPSLDLHFITKEEHDALRCKAYEYLV